VVGAVGFMLLLCIFLGPSEEGIFVAGGLS